MRIVIIGAGNTGQQLTATLCEERHDVVVVDCRDEPLKELESRLDVLTVCGEGSSPDTLRQAEIEKSDLLVAVTGQDEVNILSGILAQAVGVRHKVVRVTNTNYIQKSGPYNLMKLGIDLIINQKASCAKELYNILRLPGTQDVVDMVNGKLLAVDLKIHVDSPLLLSSLEALPNPEVLESIRFIAAMRGNKLFIPSGKTQFMIGDDVYFVGRPKDIEGFLDWAHPDHVTYRKVIISGGGELGLALARRLEPTAMQVILIEVDPVRAQYCSTHLDKTLVIKGNALDKETLENIGIDESCAFVASTGDDENNIINCQLAEQMGASFTLAQITKTEYVPIINNSSLLDRAVSPHTTMTDAILRFIRGANVQSAALLHNIPGELLEIALPPGSQWAGQPIKKIRMPKGAIIATVIRSDEVCSATGNLHLAQDDRLIIFSQPGVTNKAESIFHK